MKIKSLILTAFVAILGAVACHADDPIQMQAIGPFGGLNTNVSQEAISSSQSPDLLNVDIGTSGTSVKKRQGYGLDSVLGSTEAAHNLYKFFDSSGNEIRLAFNDKLVSSSINGATWSVILTTGTKGATWDCTDYLGFAYCVSSSFDNPIKTNGTIAGTTGAGGTNAVPSGSLVSNSGDRLLVAATAANPSRLYYSQSAVFSNFTLGIQPSDSSFEDIVAPGSKLTHIAYRFGKWLWWKDQSFGFIVGTGQFDLQIITVSNTIGTLDNTDVFDGNYVYFRGSDAQIYTYDGSVLSRAISSDIAPTLRQANRRKANSWTSSTAADWNAGTIVGLDTTTIAPSMGLTYSRLTDYSFESFVGLSSNVGWTTTGARMVPLNSPVVATCGIVTAKDGSFLMSSQDPGGGFSAKIVLSTNTATIVSSTSILATTGCAGWAPQTLSIPSFFVGDSMRFIFFSADGSTMTSIPFLSSGNSITFYTQSDSGGASTHIFFDFVDGLAVGTTTGTFKSPIHNMPLIAAWNGFSSMQTLNGGSIAFSVCSSTNSNLSAPVSCANQPNNSNVAVSTGTYVQWIATFTVTNSSQTPSLSNVSFNWYEGSASDKMYGTYFNNGIWFSMSLGTASTNNRIFRYDLLSNLWTLYDIPANGFLTYSNNLYFADPAAGKVYQFGNGVYSDNGSSINSYWKSKAFFGTDPFSDKDLRMTSWYIAEDSGTILNMTYTLNESSTIAKTVNLYDSRKNIIQNNSNMPLGSVATNFNVQFGDTSTNPPWEVFGGAVYYVPRPWKINLQ